MLNGSDIQDMSCLTREEIAAIAEHEHVGELDASRLGEYMMHLHHGPQAVSQMISEDCREALHNGDLAHAKELFATWQAFVAEHGEAARCAKA